MISDLSDLQGALPTVTVTGGGTPLVTATAEEVSITLGVGTAISDGPRQVILTEPQIGSDPNEVPTQVSDFLILTPGVNAAGLPVVLLSFFSDPLSGALLLPCGSAGPPCGPSASLQETGDFQDVSSALLLQPSDNLTIQIASDVPVPEPATMILVGTGLGLAGLRRRHRRSH